MGLVRGMARTAVVAGTATAVSNRVSRRQATKWQQEAYEQQPQQYAEPAPAPPPAAAPADDTAEQLQRLANMRAQNLINDDEYAAAKAKLLGI